MNLSFAKSVITDYAQESIATLRNSYDLEFGYAHLTHNKPSFQAYLIEYAETIYNPIRETCDFCEKPFLPGEIPVICTDTILGKEFTEFACHTCNQTMQVTYF